MGRVGKQALKDALIAQGGVVSAVAEHFRVTRQTVYNWIEDYDLHEVIDQARNAMFRVAEDNILAAVLAGDVEVSKFVVQHMPTARKRWSNRTDVAVTDVSALAISDEIAQLMREQGIAMSDVVKEFEALLRSQVAEQPRIVEGRASKKRGK